MSDTKLSILLAKEILQEFNTRISSAESEEFESLTVIKECIKICQEYLLRFKKIVLENGFISIEDEIYFFKTAKRQVYSLLYYYSEIYNIEIRRPIGNETIQLDFVTREYQRISLVYSSYSQYYHYLRTSSDALDQQYFTRKELLLDPNIPWFYYDSDTHFSTGYDSIFAVLIASDRLCEYLLMPKDSKTRHKTSIIDPKDFEWSGSLVSFCEIFDALDVAKYFGGKVQGIRKVFSFFGPLLNVHSNNPNKIRDEISMRKRNRFVAIDDLKLNYERHLTVRDQNY